MNSPAERDRTASPAARAAQVVTVGEEMVLLWPADPGQTLETAARFERSFGGAEGNFCIALARLGIRARWISRLGDDPFGRYVRAALIQEGVEVAAQADATAPTAVFFKERIPHGPRRVVYYRRGSAASRLTPDDLAPEHFAHARVVHLTGITPALSPSCAATVERAIALARGAGALVSVDPNIRLQLFPDAEACRQMLLPLLAAADLALLGDEDAAVLFPELGDEAVLDAVRALGPRTVVLKLGARGACAMDERGAARVPIYSVPIVDTVGAGDGFDAGFVAASLKGWPLERCLQVGARIGAAAVAVAGDWEGYPRRHELEPEWRGVAYDG